MKKLILNAPPWIYSIAVTALICYLTLTPNPLGATKIRLFAGADLIVHAIMFAAMTLALYFDRLRQRLTLNSMTERTLAMLAIATGGVIEMLQARCIEGRSGDLFDFIADVAGVVIAASLALLLKKRVKKWVTHQ